MGVMDAAPENFTGIIVVIVRAGAREQNFHHGATYCEITEGYMQVMDENEAMLAIYQRDVWLYAIRVKNGVSA